MQSKLKNLLIEDTNRIASNQKESNVKIADNKMVLYCLLPPRNVPVDPIQQQSVEKKTLGFEVRVKILWY